MVRLKLVRNQERTPVQREHVGEAKLVIPGRLPSMNDLFDFKEHGLVFKKKAEMARIALLAEHQRFPYVKAGLFVYRFYEPNARRDRINVIGGGVKIIEDALVNGGFLQGDGQKHVLEINPTVLVDPENPRVELTVFAVPEGGNDGKRQGKARKKASAA